MNILNAAVVWNGVQMNYKLWVGSTCTFGEFCIYLMPLLLDFMLIYEFFNYLFKFAAFNELIHDEGIVQTSINDLTKYYQKDKYFLTN